MHADMTLEELKIAGGKLMATLAMNPKIESDLKEAILGELAAIRAAIAERKAEQRKKDIVVALHTDS